LLIQIIPVRISPNVRPHDELHVLILEATGQGVQNRDILVVAHKVVSKAEGRIVSLTTVRPSRKAIRMGKEHGKDPRIMELILQESVQILRAKSGIIVSETRQGLVCANAGVDQSNVEGDSAVLLPADPDKSASRLKDAVKKKVGKDIAVVITDTFGRPFREGQANVAIGVAGLRPIKSYIGSHDMYGRKLRVSEIAVADELASAAELVMGKAESVPVAIIRGYKFDKATKSSAKSLQRPREQDLFR
jgi:coenzyme F420-0:L-glutamate ligase / coenzyme F420-1:gamma-L-glutamate ligase